MKLFVPASPCVLAPQQVDECKGYVSWGVQENGAAQLIPIELSYAQTWLCEEPEEG